MKQSSLNKSENRKYKNISVSSKETTCSDKKLVIVNSIKRISSKPDEIDKVFADVSEASTYELHEKINIATEEIINIFYDMELAVLSEGVIPLTMGNKLHALKAIVSLCKIQLCLPELNEVSFPKIFIEEYSLLLERTEKAIETIKRRMCKLKEMKREDSLSSVLEKNLFTLSMLKMHYINALGLPVMS